MCNKAECVQSVKNYTVRMEVYIEASSYSEALMYAAKVEDFARSSDLHKATAGVEVTY